MRERTKLEPFGFFGCWHHQVNRHFWNGSLEKGAILKNRFDASVNRHSRTHITHITNIYIRLTQTHTVSNRTVFSFKKQLIAFYTFSPGNFIGRTERRRSRSFSNLKIRQSAELMMFDALNRLVMYEVRVCVMYNVQLNSQLLLGDEKMHSRRCSKTNGKKLVEATILAGRTSSARYEIQISHMRWIDNWSLK